MAHIEILFRGFMTAGGCTIMRTGRNQDIVSRVEEAYQEFLSRIGEDEFTEPYRLPTESKRRRAASISF